MGHIFSNNKMIVKSYLKSYMGAINLFLSKHLIQSKHNNIV